ncbi:hypothetical protein BV22DRAFT_1105046 [Leucogyrophana mollusca]|uniref:Uncharacterized protein n=1 Tax=Leucogyrophana mollusca TaxID=85980 RepID=A0ACB8BH64_9AGAM|nr:hypothetical protein BV22DRAFT_1105046 [Leucogyrophana mollusca]
MLIEVCVDSVDSAVAFVILRSRAVRGGADRLELCGNLGLGGGTTPSIGLFTAVQKAVPGIPIMAMVRPRTGDFLYSESEFDVMLEDILAFKSHGARGVVFGVLDKSGCVDINRTQRLVNEALPLEVCFHRAFDMTMNPTTGNVRHLAWSDICEVKGITRILTSGHGKTAISQESLRELGLFLGAGADGSAVDGHPSVKICPGSGINASTLPVLCKALLPHRLEEIHLSGGQWVESAMTWRPEGMGMGVGPGKGEWGVWKTNEEAIRAIRTIADTIYMDLE